MTEKQKVEKILEGETSLFSYFVDGYQDMALTIAYRICGNKEDAKDITQNAFVKAFHNLHTYKNKSKFSTWFYRIVYNTALTALRKKKQIPDYIDYQIADLEGGEADFTPLEKMEQSEQSELINRAMCQLHPSESMVLTCYYMEEISIKEIIQITGLTKSNIKIKLYRGRKNLGKLLEKEFSNGQITL